MAARNPRLRQVALFGRLRGCVRAARRRIGVCDHLHDRYLLEEVIFPALRAKPEVHQILFVGCEWFTRHYPRRFAGREFTTIDVDPTKARYGADHHIVDSLTNLSQHFDTEALDAIVCNGVFGWGLDSPEEIDVAVRACYETLRPSGTFVVGWNDRDPWRPPAFAALESFRRFEPFAMPPFPWPVYPTLGEMRHTYNFYRRPHTRDA